MQHRFFFHFFDGEKWSRDDTGLELASAEQAYLETVTAAREMWKGLLDAQTDPMTCRFEVANAGREVLFTVEFGELLDGCRDMAQPPQMCSAILRTLEDTHSRAQRAKASLRDGFVDVRRSLDESLSLIGRLEGFQRGPRSGRREAG